MYRARPALFLPTTVSYTRTSASSCLARESGGVPGSAPGAYRVGAQFERLCFLGPVHRSQQGGIVAQDAYDIGMVRREGVFIDGERTLVERLGLLVAPLPLAETARL